MTDWPADYEAQAVRDATATPGKAPQTHIPVWPQVPEGEALSRAARALERIADALEAQPTLRDGNEQWVLDAALEYARSMDFGTATQINASREQLIEASEHMTDATRQKEGKD